MAAASTILYLCGKRRWLAVGVSRTLCDAFDPQGIQRISACKRRLIDIHLPTIRVIRVCGFHCLIYTSSIPSSVNILQMLVHESTLTSTASSKWTFNDIVLLGAFLVVALIHKLNRCTRGTKCGTSLT